MEFTKEHPIPTPSGKLLTDRELEILRENELVQLPVVDPRPYEFVREDINDLYDESDDSDGGATGTSVTQNSNSTPAPIYDQVVETIKHMRLGEEHQPPPDKRNDDSSSPQNVPGAFPSNDGQATLPTPSAESISTQNGTITTEGVGLQTELSHQPVVPEQHQEQSP